MLIALPLERESAGKSMLARIAMIAITTRSSISVNAGPEVGAKFTRGVCRAWFRLLDSASIRAENAPDRKRVIFSVGGRIAMYTMQTSGVNNPFNLPAMKTFSCPPSF